MSNLDDLRRWLALTEAALKQVKARFALVGGLPVGVHCGQRRE